MQAALLDMDGTLVDSEKLWDISLAALYNELGGTLTREVRVSLVLRGGHNPDGLHRPGTRTGPVGDGRIRTLAARLHGATVRRWIAVV